MARAKRVPRPITVKLRTSRKAVEALRLEIRRLARAMGMPAAAVRIRRTAADDSSVGS
jgi:predicted phage tail protein